MSRKTLTPSSYAVLGLLARRPSSGYELGTRAAASIDNFWPLTRTHIYGELAKLEALGYVVGVEVTQELLPDKRVYSVTPEGAWALDTWLDNPDPGVPRPRQPMLVKLFFGERFAPEQAAALLTRYRTQALARRDWLAAAAVADAAAVAADPESPRRFGRATALFGLRRAEADLAWVDEVWAELGLPNLEGDAAADDPG
ncbi:MAG: PadR family transcriptional regulator [Thermomicrobiales bacterium]|nr:PadR family transcriptional regulator [Thermomicrobiales bacterium]